MSGCCRVRGSWVIFFFTLFQVGGNGIDSKLASKVLKGMLGNGFGKDICNLMGWSNEPSDKSTKSHLFSNKVIINGNMFWPRVKDRVNRHVQGTQVVWKKLCRMMKVNTNISKKNCNLSNFCRSHCHGMILSFWTWPGYCWLFFRGPRDTITP